VVRTAIEAEVKRLILFHHDPIRTDDHVDQFLAEARARAREAGSTMQIDAAAEGMEILLPVKTGAALAAV